MGSEEVETSELEQVSQGGVPTLRGRSYTDSEEVRMGERRYCRIQELELDKALESARRIAGFLDSVETCVLPLALNALVLACRRRLIELSGATLPPRQNDYTHPFPWESFTSLSFSEGRYSTPQRLKDTFASRGINDRIDILGDEDLELIYEHELTVPEWAMGNKASRGQVMILVKHEKDTERKAQWVRMVDFAIPE